MSTSRRVTRRTPGTRGGTAVLALSAAAALTLPVVTASAATAAATPLPGGIYVERIGGTSTFGTAGTQTGNATFQFPIFIDTFTINATTPQQTITIPTADNGANKGMTTVVSETPAVSTTSDSTGYLQASPNGRFLTFAGGPTGTSTKVIGKLDATNGSLDTTANFSLNATAARTAVTPDGVNYYFGGSGGGTVYVTPSTTTPGTFDKLTINNGNQRMPAIFGGQLFTDGAASNGGVVSGTQPGLAVIGAGLPVINTAASLPGAGMRYIMTTANPEQYVMLDQDPAVGFVNTTGDPSTSFNTKLDVTYIATDLGVEKWTYNGSAWTQAYVLNGGLGTSSEITTRMAGVMFAGKDASGKNILYATTAGNDTDTTSTEGNALMKLVDTGAGATWQLVTLSADNTWMRGIQIVKSPGDATGDWKINKDDYALADRGLARYASGQIAPGAATWTDGDFNYDGAVTSADMMLLDTAYLQSGASDPGLLAERESEFGNAYVSALVASVPEPSTIAFIAAAIPLATRRRRS